MKYISFRLLVQSALTIILISHRSTKPLKWLHPASEITFCLISSNITTCNGITNFICKSNQATVRGICQLLFRRTILPVSIIFFSALWNFLDLPSAINIPPDTRKFITFPWLFIRIAFDSLLNVILMIFPH